MAFVKQFLTKTRPSDNTSMFRYAPVLSSGQVEIYSLISISNDVEAETSRFNKFVWDGFLDGFLSKDEDIISRLKNAIIGAEFKLKELIRHDNVLEEKGVDLNLSVLVFKDDKVFVGVLGNHKVFVYKKKLVDITELLSRGKANVGSTLISAEDVFVVSYSEGGLKEDLSKLKKFREISGFLSNVFEKEDAKGGAFVASLQEESSMEEEKVAPLPIKEQKVEEDVEEVESDVGLEDNNLEEDTPLEPMKSEEVVEKDEGEKEEKIKSKLGAFWAKLKMGFDKIITFLSVKFSALYEKVRNSLNNKYGRRRWFKKLQSVSSVKKFTKGVKPFKVDGYKDKELRSKRFVIFFVILFLVVAVFLGVRATFEARQSAVLAEELNTLMEEWEDSLERADRKSSEEFEESIEILNEISKDFEDYLSDLEDQNLLRRFRDEDLERIDEFEKALFGTRDSIYRIIPLSEDEGNIELFLDTKLDLGEKSSPVDFVISRDAGIVFGEMLYVLDAGLNEVHEVFLRDGNSRSIDDPNDLIKEPMFIDIGNNKSDPALYVYDARSGALRAATDEDGNFNDFKSLSGLTPRNLGGDGVSAFAVFGPTDSLNFLVPSESRIVRAQGFGGTTYNLPSEYISHPSFEEGTDLFGDQYIYVLSTITNGIRRFVPLTGLSSQLAVTGLVEDIQSLTAGYTGSTMNRTLVLFDSDTQRFLQFSKPIEIGETLVHPGEIVLKHQYEYRGERSDIFNNVRSLVLTHDDKEMYVLDGTRIWKINID